MTALSNKYWSCSEVRSHGGLGIWPDFLEEVGFKMGLNRWVGQMKQTKEKAFLEVRGTEELGEVSLK